MREREGTLFEESLREGEGARIPRRFLSLEGKSFSSGGWHASLGEGLAHTSRLLQH
jgi:hypothetical protein